MTGLPPREADVPGPYSASADGVTRGGRNGGLWGLGTPFLFLRSRQADFAKQASGHPGKVKPRPFPAKCKKKGVEEREGGSYFVINRPLGHLMMTMS